ncbi:AAA family ATPase [Nesterenkonia haasae]|uniref:AAA family ATPase n=1 Tax=Nesterenkonia haasae TaxID=2587813 RepID=UPI00192E8BA4|nr:ATP-binding protein [Nesterenkonia haasae]
MARRYRDNNPDVAKAIVETLREGPTRSVASGQSLDAPLDSESKLPLIREESLTPQQQPILDAGVRAPLEQVIEEHVNGSRLLEAGLAPTGTVLLSGPPGVGKTLAAHWMAQSIGLPLFVLDLSAVMNSLLGQTGANIKRVFDHARRTPSVLFLDEIDAVAKKRDDNAEVGELKRLVTVLLQEIDNWPEGSLLVSATNHSQLLDPALWRRFDVILEFPLPSLDSLAEGAATFFDAPMPQATLRMIAKLYEGETLSRLERDVLRARRTAALRGTDPVQALLGAVHDRFDSMPVRDRGRVAADLSKHAGLSQRVISELTGVSRDTIRKYSRAT